VCYLGYGTLVVVLAAGLGGAVAVSCVLTLACTVVDIGTTRRFLPDQEIPRRAARDYRSLPYRETGDFPIPAESGIGDSLPVSRPNRESGERELGISGSAYCSCTPPKCQSALEVLSCGRRLSVYSDPNN
jgi:hypothetical protein